MGTGRREGEAPRPILAARTGSLCAVLILAAGCGAGGASPPPQPAGEYERLHGSDIERAKRLYAEGKPQEGAAILKPLLKDENWEVRVRAIRAVGDAKDRTLLPEIHAALSDANLEIRESAGRVLTWLGDDSSIPFLLKALSDKEPVIREHSVEALARIGGAGQRETLERVAKEDPDAGVRAAATEALGHLGSEEP